MAMENFNFRQYDKTRKRFLKENADKSFVIGKGEGNVMLSAPHGVSQVRLGKYKFSEIGSLALMLEVQKRTGAHFIAKTKNCNDDANFDEICPYKESLKRYIKENNIKYLFDFHGLGRKRKMDVNLGTCLGQNIKSNENLYDYLHYNLKSAGFVVTVDNPFMAYAGTIAGNVHKELGIWTIQVEVNCSITNGEKEIEKLESLIEILVEVVKKAQISNH